MGKVNELFQEYLNKKLSKEKVEPSSLIEENPEEASHLEEKLTALRAMEDFFSEMPALTPSEEINLSGLSDPFVGKEIGGCKILKEVGRGGMGVVYLGSQTELDRMVAIKVLRLFPGAAQSLGRFRREAKSIARLNHPNIVPIYSIGDEEGYSYIIMKLIEGIPLSDLIDKLSNSDRQEFKPQKIRHLIESRLNHLPSEEIPLPKQKTFNEWACDCISQISQAIYYAHSQGVIHRDVKPSNIILTTDGKPVLLDFGLSRDETGKRMTLTGEFLGTPTYSAPECLTGKLSPVSHQIDVYSLGATLYELLTSQTPFQGESYNEILNNITMGEPTPPQKYNPRIPRDLSTILLKAIAKEPSQRYLTAGDLNDDLQCFLKSKPIKAKPPSFFYKTSKWIRRNSKVASLGFVGALMVLALLGGYYYNKYHKAQEIRRQVYEFANAGDYEKAIEKLTEATALFPKRPEAWFYLGQFQSLAGDYENGIKNIERAIQLDKKPEYYLTLSLAQFEYNKVGQAEQSINTLLKKEPDNYLALQFKALFQVYQNRIDEALGIFNQAFNMELDGLPDDELVQYAAYSNPAASALIILYNEKKDIRQAFSTFDRAMSFFPYNGQIIQMGFSLPLTEIEKKKLTQTKKGVSTNVVRFYNHPIEVTMPFGWMRQIVYQRYGKDILAEFGGYPVSPATLVGPPSILIGHLKTEGRDALETAHKFIDQLTVKFKGGTLEREVTEIENHPDKRYIIDTEAAIPLGKLKAKTLVAERDGRIYLLTGIAPVSDFNRYEKEIMNSLHSIRFVDQKPWLEFIPPNQAFQIQFPQTPFFYQIKTLGSAKENITKHFVFFSRIRDEAQTKFAIEDIEYGSPVTDQEKRNRGFNHLIKLLKQKGKISNQKREVTDGNYQMNVDLLDETTRTTVRSFFKGNHQFVLKVQQDKKKPDESMISTFFNSFKSEQAP